MIDTDEVTRRIKNSEQIVFVKFGDGEMNCMLGYEGSNCDDDPYTPSLRNGLLNSLYYYTSCNNKNIFIGRWHDETIMNRILEAYEFNTPQFTRYHLIMNTNDFFKDNYMYEFLKSIQDTKRKKIVFSNEKNKRMKDLFKADTFITVPPRNWYVEYGKYFELIKNEITENCIVFTAAGQGSKVIVANLLMLFPNLTCLDIGSSFDFLCQKTKSRAWEHTYEDEYNYYKDLLPDNW
jgi:hypothetical protein